MTYPTGGTYANYMQFLTPDGTPIPNRAYQNHFIGQSRFWDGALYAFAPVAIGGDLISNAQASSRASVAMAPNIITQAVAAEAALNRWLLSVRYVALNLIEELPVPRWLEVATIAEDLWMCSGYTTNRGENAAVILELASPLDAVDARSPNCLLQSSQVGALPTTGTVLLS
jgi:hypothetical protein